MIALGINGIEGIFHDASASLVVDGMVTASVEEERFNRNKHSDGVPFQAMDYVLRQAGIKLSDVDHIGYYLEPDVVEENFYKIPIDQYGARPDSVQYMKTTSDALRRIPDRLAAWRPMKTGAQFHFLNHHLCHAASAFYASGFEQAAVLTIDGSGDRESASLYLGSASGLTKIADFLIYPRSLGFIYTTFSAHLGLGWIEGPGKLMGLSAYGTPHPKTFTDIMRLTDDPLRPVDINLSHFGYHLGISELGPRLCERFGSARHPDQPLDQQHLDVAATVQDVISDAIMHIARQVPRLLPRARNLCYSGGLALNVITNRRIVDSNLFERVFIAPAAYDGGCSLGAALELSTRFDGFRIRAPFNPYLGPDIESDYDIHAAVIDHASAVSAEELNEESLPQRAADDLAAPGKQRIIGWAQGRMECGPRALGNRSILASPIPPDSKEQLNARVKKREGFRPYAPSVLAGEAVNWFDLSSSPYMLLEAFVKPECRARVPGISHVNGSSRPQTVTEADNPRYYRLLKAFQERTGVPMLLNTSFNRHGEPIVNTPEDAISVLLDTDMDVLYIGRFRIEKRVV